MEWDKLKPAILERIKPDPDESNEVKVLVEVLIRRLSLHLREKDIEASVEVHGSVIHDTWLKGDHDLDIFVVLPPTKSIEYLKVVLDEVKVFLGEGWVEAYAEHPYIKIDISGLSVDFVPCFRVENGRLISSTDRTPLHTAFLAEKLNPEQRDEVRILKQFLRGIEVYGAEIKVGGFSGYLAELLIVTHGSFLDVLKAARNWRRGELISPTSFDDKGKHNFGEPLIIIDPVDHSRNAASAVSETSMWTFIAAARQFLENPDEKFFFPTRKNVEKIDLIKLLKSRGMDTVFLVINDSNPDVSDILWGQLKKTEKTLKRQLQIGGFQVDRTFVWSDEKNKHVFVLELETVTLPCTEKKLGPPVALTADCENFIKEYVNKEITVAGPGVEGDRWWVIVMRPYRNVGDYLRNVLKDGGSTLGIPRKISEDIAKGFQLLINSEAESILEGEFQAKLYEFMIGRPMWLE